MSGDGKCYLVHPPPKLFSNSLLVHTLRMESPGEAYSVLVYVACDSLVGLCSTARLCSPRTPCASGIRMIKSARPGRPFFPSRWAPEYIRIMPDADGIVRPPVFQVGDLFDARHRWAHLIGPLSGEATAVLSGFMQYPRKSHAVTVSRAKNHDSWACNPIARFALGPKMGGYMFSGVLEFNGGECPPPTVINPLGIVPKNSETLPFRLVSDARKGNLSLEKWPVRLSKG